MLYQSNEPIVTIRVLELYKNRPMYMKAEVSDMDILHLSQAFIMSTFTDPTSIH